jgi:RND family efflux transporter MFP subunit
MIKPLLTIFLAAIVLFSCNEQKEKKEDTEKVSLLANKNSVEVMILSKSAFPKQLVSNGKLNALRKSELKFRLSGEIAQVSVKSGEHVASGQMLARLNDVDYRQRLAQVQTSLKKSSLDLQDVLIGLGYDPKDSSSIPIDKMELARIKSGYASNLSEYETAKRNLNDCQLSAPFSGLVANITQKAYEQTNGQAFCTLIDDSRFEVVFQVLETELESITMGSGVKVIPYSNESLVVTGTITEINPIVDENGLVQVKAQVQNPGSLIEGMNVKVLIEKEVPDQFVVPKSAVVLRDNFEVLFKVVNGKAYWTYIKTVLENSDSYSVIPNPDKESASLNVGDTVIVSGNLNLAHESEVEIK